MDKDGPSGPSLVALIVQLWPNLTVDGLYSNQDTRDIKRQVIGRSRTYMKFLYKI